MDEIIINGMPLSIKEYEGKRIVTFKDIDMCHKRPEGTARRNFNTNKEHFIEGEDYFVRNSYEAKKEFGIAAPNGLTLITESGYYMLVKSFTDDLSWDVQRQLVNSYFKVERPQPIQQLSPMEMIAAMANNAVEMERRLKATENKIAETSSKLEQALDVFTEIPEGADWKSIMNHRINLLCEQNKLNHQRTRGTLYKELELRVHCCLTNRVGQKKKRLKNAGAKYAEQAAVSKLDVIADDPKLRIAFDSIVKKLEAKYIQGDNVQMGMLET